MVFRVEFKAVLVEEPGDVWHRQWPVSPIGVGSIPITLIDA